MKKRISILLILAVALSLCACGSGKNTAAPAPAPAAPEQSTGELGAPSAGMRTRVYTEKAYPLEAGCTVGGVARLGNTLLIKSYRNEEALLAMAEFTLTPGERLSLSAARPVALDEPEAADEASIYGITAGGDGYFYVLTGETPEQMFTEDFEEIRNEDFQGNFSILKYSQDGEFIDRLKISAWPERRQLTGLVDVTGLAVGSEGELYLFGGFYVALLNWEGERLHTEYIDEMSSSIIGAALTEKGVVFSVWSNSSFGTIYYLADRDGTLSQIETGEMDRDLLTAGFTDCQGLNGEYIMDTGYDFVQYDFDSGTYETILNWNMSQTSINSAVRVGEREFICVSVSEGCLLLVGQEEVPDVERSLVKVAIISDWTNPGTQFDTLNNDSDKYEYSVTAYTSDEADRFLTALGAGDTPDLVLFNSNLNTDKGYFEDLYPYIDSDPELSRESFLPNLLEAISGGGELHQLWPDVEIQTVAARVSDVGDGKGLTVADCRRMVEEKEQYLAVFESFMGKGNYLAWVANMGVASCLDRENATCHFDDESYGELIAWSREMGDDIPALGGGTGPVNVTTEESLLRAIYIQTPRQVHGLREVYGEPYVFTGFPNGEEGFSAYTLPYSSQAMAIPTAARNKEGAWDYIRGVLRMEKQVSGPFDNYTPTNYDALKRMIAADEVMTEEDAALLEQLFSATKFAAVSSDRVVVDLIIECGQQYLSGDKSIEETMALLQSKASIYMAEQYS